MNKHSKMFLGVKIAKDDEKYQHYKLGFGLVSFDVHGARLLLWA